MCTFISVHGVYIKFPLNLLKVEVIANIQYYICTRNKLIYRYKLQWILPTHMLASLVKYLNFGAWCIDERYSQHYMSDFTVLYSTIPWCKLLTVTLALLGILFRRLIFISAGKITNIIFHLILFSMTFQLTLTNKIYCQQLC